MRLTVTLTEKEAEVFFNMLAHSTNEVSDIDYNELIEIESKFKKAKETDSTWVNNNINPYYKQNEPIVVELKNGLTITLSCPACSRGLNVERWRKI